MDHFVVGLGGFISPSLGALRGAFGKLWGGMFVGRLGALGGNLRGAWLALGKSLAGPWGGGALQGAWGILIRGLECIWEALGIHLGEAQVDFDWILINKKTMSQKQQNIYEVNLTRRPNLILA